MRRAAVIRNGVAVIHHVDQAEAGVRPYQLRLLAALAELFAGAA